MKLVTHVEWRDVPGDLWPHRVIGSSGSVIETAIEGRRYWTGAGKSEVIGFTPDAWGVLGPYVEHLAYLHRASNGEVGRLEAEIRDVRVAGCVREAELLACLRLARLRLARQRVAAWILGLLCFVVGVALSALR
jgi:hypothetical protein